MAALLVRGNVSGGSRPTVPMRQSRHKGLATAARHLDTPTETGSALVAHRHLAARCLVALRPTIGTDPDEPAAPTIDPATVPGSVTVCDFTADSAMLLTM